MNVFWMTGGIGNQLFIYAAAKQIENETGEAVIIDITNYKWDFRSFKLDQIGIEVKTVSWFKLLVFRPKIRDIIGFFKFLSKYKSATFNENDSKDGANSNILFKYYKGYWHETKYFENVINEIRDQVNLVSKLKNEKYRFWIDKIHKSKSVSIHVRRTDYLSVQNVHTYVELDHTYYNNCCNKITEKHPDAEFFIFTDDEDWVKENLNLNLNKVYFVSGNVQNDCIEFELFRNCKFNIIANSTFSWWSASLNVNVDYLVFAPENYYKNAELNKQYKSREILFNSKFIYI
jgi:hypothetical protein